MKAKLRDFWVEDRAIFIVLTVSLLVALASFIASSFVPKRSENTLDYVGLGIIIVAGYGAGWARGRRGKQRSIAAREGNASSTARGIAEFVGDYGFLGGIAAYGYEAGNPHHALIRLGGAICFVAWAGAEIASARLGVRPALSSRKSRRIPIGISGMLGLGMAFEITAPQPHETQPHWLTVVGIVFMLGLIALVPYTVVEWVRRSDERESAIANRSLAFAFVVSMTLVLAFSLMQSLKIGPSLRPDYVIATAATSWFAAWFVLQRRM